MKYLKSLIIIGCLLFTVFPVNAQDKKVLKLGVGDTSTAVINAYGEFIKQAYAEIGYDVEIVKLPIKRLVEDSEVGNIDGMLLMSRKATESTRNILIVPTPITFTDVSVFTKDKEFKVTGPNSLKPYKIGVIRGYPVTEQLTDGLNRHIVDSFDSLFKMIQAGRLDVGIVMRQEALRFLKEHSEFRDIKMLTPPLFSIPLHNLLHKKHEALIPMVNPIIERKIKDGVLKKLLAPYQV